MILGIDDLLSIAGIMVAIISPTIALSWSTRMKLETLAGRLIKLETEHKINHTGERKKYEAF